MNEKFVSEGKKKPGRKKKKENFCEEKFMSRQSRGPPFETRDGRERVTKFNLLGLA